MWFVVSCLLVVTAKEIVKIILLALGIQVLDKTQRILVSENKRQRVRLWRNCQELLIFILRQIGHKPAMSNIPIWFYT